MPVPILAQCPSCQRGVKWFYGTRRFARHNSRVGGLCAGMAWEGVQKGASPSASGNSLRWNPRKPSAVQGGEGH